MRITGIVVALAGVVIALFCGIAYMNDKTPSESDAVIVTESRPGINLTVPLLISAAAVVAGGAMIVLGGRVTQTTTAPSSRPAIPG